LNTVFKRLFLDIKNIAIDLLDFFFDKHLHKFIFIVLNHIKFYFLNFLPLKIFLKN